MSRRDSGQPSLVLVRHGRPEVKADIPAAEWPLSAEGRATAAALAGALSALEVAAALSSPEPKAWETTKIVAERLGVVPKVEPGLAEHQRDPWGFTDIDVFRTRVAAVLSEPNRSCCGAETGEAARRRFESVLERNPGRPLLIGSHGTILSLYLSRLLQADPVALWRSLGFAEALVLNASGALITRIKGAGR